MYKCTTNPKVATAHRWAEIDPKGRMNKPTGTQVEFAFSDVHVRAECFFSKEGKWYYAGQYIALRLENLSVKEWEALDSEVVAYLADPS